MIDAKLAYDGTCRTSNQLNSATLKRVPEIESFISDCMSRGEFMGCITVNLEGATLLKVGEKSYEYKTLVDSYRKDPGNSELQDVHYAGFEIIKALIHFGYRCHLEDADAENEITIFINWKKR